ncbi:MAG: hypothetical protein DRQ01_09075 [Ignavibacteriae bacterium]|nr:MAG: hypothetical protein DRQ01_09075 [Ignavibacteriota bacterium]
MQRDKSYLIDIQISAESIVRYIEGKSSSTFYEDEMLQDAVIRRIEIMGEAASRISEDLKSQYPTLPWKKMKAMRNILIHMYDELELEIVWDTITKDIPGLLNEMKKILPHIQD